MKKGGFKNRILPYLAVILGFAIVAGIIGNAGIHRLDTVTVRLSEAGYGKTGLTEEIAAPEPEASPEPVPTAEPEPAKLLLERAILGSSSVERDLYVFLKDSNGNTIRDRGFTIELEYPDGQKLKYVSDSGGSCCISGLDPGMYYVSLVEMEGYEAETVLCQVKGTLEYTKIEDIDSVVDVVSIESVAQETKTSSGGSAGDIIQFVSTESETQSGQAGESQNPPSGQDDGGNAAGISAVTEEPAQMPSDSGNQGQAESGSEPAVTIVTETIRRVSYETGENGFLLLTDGTESVLIPVEEDGELLYALKAADDGNGGTIYQAVELFNADGSPIGGYAITVSTETVEIEEPAEPAAEPESQAVPIPEDDAGASATTRSGWITENGKTYFMDSRGEYLKGLVNLDGKLYFFDSNGVRASSLGIDVSYFNGNIDWNLIKAQGIDFAIIRVGGRGWTTGQLYDDVKFSQYIYGAKAAGLSVGVYFYSTAVSELEAVEEASVVLDRLEGIALDFPVYIDMEFSGEYPLGRSDAIYSGTRTAIANAFCRTIESGGYRAGVYSGESYLQTAIWPLQLQTEYIWLASYTRNLTYPNYPYSYGMWQFTDSGRVKGINGYVDMSVIF